LSVTAATTEDGEVLEKALWIKAKPERWFLRWSLICLLCLAMWCGLFIGAVVIHIEYKDLCEREDDVFGIFGICLLVYMCSRVAVTEVMFVSAFCIGKRRGGAGFASGTWPAFHLGQRIRIANATLIACDGGGDDDSATTAAEDCDTDFASTERALLSLNRRVTAAAEQVRRLYGRQGMRRRLRRVLFVADAVPLFSLIFFVFLGVQATRPASSSDDVSRRNDFDDRCGIRSLTFNWALVVVVIFYAVAVNVPLLVAYGGRSAKQDSEVGGGSEKRPRTPFGTPEVDDQEHPPEKEQRADYVSDPGH
jgi:hypothetical protein